MIAFSDIDRIERHPWRGEISPMGEVTRMRLHLRAGAHGDILPAGDTLDGWLLDVRESDGWWLRRARAEAA